MSGVFEKAPYNQQNNETDGEGGDDGYRLQVRHGILREDRSEMIEGVALFCLVRVAYSRTWRWDCG